MRWLGARCAAAPFSPVLASARSEVGEGPSRPTRWGCWVRGGLGGLGCRWASKPASPPSFILFISFSLFLEKKREGKIEGVFVGF